MRQTEQLVLVLAVAPAGTTPTIAPYEQPLTFTRWEDTQVPFKLIDYKAAPVDASGGAFIFTARRNYFDPDPAALSKLGVDVDYTSGLGYFQAGAADNGALEVTDENAPYSYDVVFIDNAGLYGEAGERYACLPASALHIAPAIGLPGSLVTPSPGEPPLGAGPKGDPGLGALTARVAALVSITAAGTQTINGVAAVVGDVVLRTADGVGNGPWTVASGSWVRLAPLTVNAHVASQVVMVSEGTIGPNSEWRCTNQAPLDVIGNDSLTFLRVLAKPLATAGAVGRSDASGNKTDQRLTYNDIDPAFALSSFASGAVVNKEIGDTISNPAFTAGANQTIAAASLNDGAGAVALTVAPFTSFAYGVAPLPDRSGGAAFKKIVPGQSVTFTLIAQNAGGNSDSRTLTATWTDLAFYGHAVPGTLNAAFIHALSTSRQQVSSAGAYAFSSPGAGEKLYVAIDAAFADPTSIKDQNGDSFPMSKVATGVSVTNGFGVVRTYNVWASDNFIAGFAFTVTWS